MKSPSIPTISKLPISYRDFSEQFIAACVLHEFYTIGDLLKHNIRSLFTLDLFDERMLSEYIAFLEIHGLERMVKP